MSFSILSALILAISIIYGVGALAQASTIDAVVLNQAMKVSISAFILSVVFVVVGFVTLKCVRISMSFLRRVKDSF